LTRLSETIYCHSGVPQGSHLGSLIFIANINDVLDIFENVWVLAYADDLKLYMRVSRTDDCRLFQQDLECWEMQKSIPFFRGLKPAISSVLM
jgi:hypothetical protein